MDNGDANLDQILDWVLRDNEFDQSLFDREFRDIDTTQKNKTSHKSSNNSTSEEEITELQLKLLPSKERRQIRNKISARNFRNRRKEYLTSLEAKIERYESENNQLKYEVKWVRDMMSKLQIENDKLRLELALCKGGVQQTQPIATSMTAAPTTTLTGIAAVPPVQPTAITLAPNIIPNNVYIEPSMHWAMNILNQPNTIAPINPNTMLTLHTNTMLPIHSSNNTDPIFFSTSSISSDENECTSALPVPSRNNNNNMFIAHASLPNWDLSCLLEKSKCVPRVELIRTYPLLVPALMSIVIQQAMSLSSKELSLPKKNASDTIIQSLPTREEDKFIASLSDTILWDSILPKTKQLQVQEVEEQEDREENEKNAMQEHCPLLWIQKQFCKFILFYVVAKYPRLNKPCRTYLPICEKFRIGN